MMRVLILSDSHGAVYNIRKIIDKHDDISTIIFLGDGERDFMRIEHKLENKSLVKVAGNCDFSSESKNIELIRIEDKLVLCLHGHTMGAKYGDELIIEKAKELECSLVLYGHTHRQKVRYENGIYIFNPGNLNEGYYGIADITKSGICVSELNINRYNQ